jgi:DNA polymerase-1
MTHPQDYQGMLYGLEVMTRDIDDTKVIAYLALNTTAELSLGLKDLGHEYAGDYAESDIKNIRLIPQESLLKYNLTDCLTTWFVFDKYYPVMLQDSQQHIYETIMKPSIKILIQMELVGMPIDPQRVWEVEQELEELKAKYLKQLADSTSVQTCEKVIKLKELTAINAKLKTKQHGLEKVADYVFNPNSGNHLIELLYNVMNLPVIDTTATKLPSTSGDTLEKLLNHTSNQDYTIALTALIGLSKVEKILTSFIPSFKQAVLKGDGMGWLHANFNLNGTMSGRLSCSKPNLQQSPSGSIFGKLIKFCFTAPKGWVFAGADFASLEDRINTLLTKDTNKLKVYTDGYDGHCLRAAYYFKIPVDVNNVAEVNAIKKTHPEERQDSKAPTFALTYMGTWATLMKNCGFSEQLSKEIETNYHELYKESDAWAKDKLDLCCKQGYIDVAFGLRIRTPLLAKSVLDNSKTLREAQAEARSVGNAISGQSYGLLNNRAAIAFMSRVWASEFKYDVFLVSLIHDAIYLIMKDDIRVVEWVNNALTEEMSWQELPEIQHPQVKLGAELDVFYGGWHQPITLPNHASKEDILRICKEGVDEYNKPKP